MSKIWVKSSLECYWKWFHRSTEQTELRTLQDNVDLWSLGVT